MTTKRRQAATTAAADDEDAKFFIASATWQGVRRGYYFGTTVEHGTGYYLDSFATTTVVSSSSGDTINSTMNHINNNSNDTNKKKKRRVRIDESANETNVISIIASSTGRSNEEEEEEEKKNAAAALLLTDAEQRAAGRKIVTMTRAGVIAAGVALHRAMDQNTLLRAKDGSGTGAGAYAESYMDSEIALYEQIASLKAFAADPMILFEPLLLVNHHDKPQPINKINDVDDEKEQTTTCTILDDLMQLLLHDNTDIAVAVTSVLLEWLDADSVDEAPIVADLARDLVSRNAVELLVDNLYRIGSGDDDTDNNNDDEVGRGTEDILSVLENLLDIEQQQGDDNNLPSTKTTVILCRDTKLIPWLLTTASSRSIEILSHITSREESHRIITNWGAIPTTTTTIEGGEKNKKLDGIEILLQIVAQFRKSQPIDAVQVELLENTGMAMAGILNYSPESVRSFLDAQGIELVLRCVKEKVYAGFVAWKWLDFSSSGGATADSNSSDRSVYQLACERAVDAGLFKYLFALFQGKAYPRRYNHSDGYAATTTAAAVKKDRKVMNQSIQNTTIRILYALMCHLRPRDGQERRERMVAKFANVAITQRLVELLLEFDQKVRIAEYNFYKADVEDDDDLDETVVQFAALEAKLAAGGDTLHRLSAIAAFCCAESKSIHASILALLQAKQSGVSLVREALLEFLSVLDDTSPFKEQLQTLVEVLI